MDKNTGVETDQSIVKKESGDPSKQTLMPDWRGTQESSVEATEKLGAFTADPEGKD